MGMLLFSPPPLPAFQTPLPKKKKQKKLKSRKGNIIPLNQVCTYIPYILLFLLKWNCSVLRRSSLSKLNVSELHIWIYRSYAVLSRSVLTRRRWQDQWTIVDSFGGCQAMGRSRPCFMQNLSLMNEHDFFGTFTNNWCSFLNTETA